MKAGVGFSNGDYVTSSRYYAGGELVKDLNFIVVDGGTGVDDGGFYHDLLGGKQAKLIQNGSINAKQFGLVDDGAIGNTTRYLAFIALAGNDFTVDFTGAGTFFFDTSRPDLSGPYWRLDAVVTIKVEENPDTSVLMRYLTPVTIEDPVLLVTQTKPANVQIPYELYNSGAGNIAPSKEEYSQLLISDFVATNISGYNTRSAFGGTITADKFVAWGTQQAEESGIFKRAYVGEYHEATFFMSGADTPAGGNTQNVNVITDTHRYLMRNYVAEGKVDFLRINSAGTVTVLKTVSPTPNGGVYAISPNGGSITSAVRLVSRNKIELYINDVIFAAFDILGDVQEIGYTANPAATLPSQGNQILRPFVAVGKIPKGSNELNIGVIGDSVSAGSWDNITWPQLLASCAQNMHGIGKLNVTNQSVGGVVWDYYATGAGASIDYSSFDYVMVQLGTNDVQSSTNSASLETAVNTVLQKIIDDGAKPIVSMFPVWTTQAVTGTGVDSVLPQEAGKYRSQIRDLALAKGCIFANPCGYFGNNLSWLSDNIHPSTEGQVAIATAFAAALSTSLELPEINYGETAKTYLTLQNGFTNHNALTHEPLSVSIDSSGMVTVQGELNNGTLTTVFATLPEGFRPSRSMVFVISATGGYGEMLITSNGEMKVTLGTATGYLGISATFKKN